MDLLVVPSQRIPYHLLRGQQSPLKGVKAYVTSVPTCLLHARMLVDK